MDMRLSRLEISCFKHVLLTNPREKALLNHNAKVYLAARNPDKAQAAISQLKEETGKEALYLHLDLADLASVRASAQEFLSSVDTFIISSVLLILDKRAGKSQNFTSFSTTRKCLYSSSR